MVVALRLRQALILWVAIFYGIGECNMFISYRDNVNCSDVDCTPLRIINVEFFSNISTIYPVCTNGILIVQQNKYKAETFFNTQCPTTNAGPAYNKSNIEYTCRTQGKIRIVRVTYNCSSATAATPTVGRATTLSVKEGFGSTTSDTANGFTTSDAAKVSRDGNLTSPLNTTIIGGGTVAAAVCTPICALFIVFVGVYLWRRKLWKKCLPQSKRQDRETFSPHSAPNDPLATTSGENLYENGNTSPPKWPAIGTKATASLGDASSRTKNCDDNSEERYIVEVPCYLEILPTDSDYERLSQKSHATHFSDVSKVQDEKIEEKHENNYTSLASDNEYFVLEQFSADPSTAENLKAISPTQTMFKAET